MLVAVLLVILSDRERQLTPQAEATKPVAAAQPTRGIVSGWSNDDFNGGGKAWLRTDAEIDAGNSGGAALNAKGELIGVPSACFYAGDEGEEVCAARPIHLAFGLAAWNIPDLKRALQIN